MLVPSPSNIRICIVVSGHPNVIIGGAQYQAHLLAEECAGRQGIAVSYLGRGMPQGKDAHGLSYNVVKTGSACGIRARALFFDALAIWRALSAIRPHVIYQRMKQSYTGICALYARRHNVPMFFHVAGAADVSRRWTRQRMSVNLPFDVLETNIGNWGLLHASHIIVQSQSQARLLEQNFHRLPVQVVGNFQPLPRELPQKPEGKTCVLWVGNFKDVKRPEIFVELARSFNGRLDIEFWMVGMAAKQRRFDGLMAAIKSCPNLRYFGQLPLTEVNWLMSQADILVNTSRSEGFPNTFIQAWANGAVVVSLVFDIDNGLDSQGIGFCAGDFARLRDVIADLASSSPKRRAFSVRAFEYVHKMHSLGNAVRLADLMVNTARAVNASTGQSQSAP
jgi:glycosyltransferase involved in cell wall biosynthesis